MSDGDHLDLKHPLSEQKGEREGWVAHFDWKRREWKREKERERERVRWSEI